jgi:ATP-dependent DNA ligase
MLLQAVTKPFDSSDYIFEWKVDGVRCIMFFNHGQVKLQSRHGKDCTKAFPELWTPTINAEEAIFDGELVVLTNGKPDFEAVMERYMSNPKKILRLLESKPSFYIVWDILWLDGQKLLGVPLLDRKDKLNQTVSDNDVMCKIDLVDSDGLDYWDVIKAQGLEGIVAKAKSSKYLLDKRSPAWLKIKNYQEVVVNVMGYKRKDGFVLVGTGDRIQGHAIGMPATDRVVMRELLDSYGTEKGGTIWLPSGIRGRVKFTTWTPRGNMRDCSWVRFEV